MKTRVVLVLLAAAAAFVPLNPVSVERWYATGIYPRLQSVVTPLTNRVPVALLDIAVGVLVVLGAVIFIRDARTAGARRAVLRIGGSLLTCAAVVYLLFLALWGLNYRRVPLERKLDYDRARVTRDAAIALANTSVLAMNGGYRAAHATRDDRASLESSFAAVQRALGTTTLAATGVPKRSLLSLYFRRAAIDGMTDPVFLEVILNPDVLPIERPFVLAHEWAHLAGYADESEANFVAWLTCIRGDPLAQYSGWVSTYGHAIGGVPREARRSLQPLESGPREDLRAIGARYNRSSPRVRAAARDVYDGYLRANRVAEGIGSYDAVLRLMLGTRFDPGWTPRRR